MNREEIQRIMEGEKGDDQQFAMLWFIIKEHIDRAFFAHRVFASNGFELRTNLQGILLTYNGQAPHRSKAASQRSALRSGSNA